MTLSWEEIEDRAVGFRKNWEKQKGAERQEAQMFVRELLAVFGVENPLDNGGEFEHKTLKEWGDDGYIDYFLPKKIIVEMKKRDWGRGTRDEGRETQSYYLYSE